MKRTLFLSIVIIFIISMVGCDNKLSTNELYQLQDKCGKRCEEWVNKKYTKEEVSVYECHYNKKMNKCFILIDTIELDELDKKNIYSLKTLIDINENKKYGTFVRTKNDVSCSVLIGKEYKYCNLNEWYVLVKPYMEE